MAKIIVARDGQGEPLIEQRIQLSKERMSLGRHPRSDIVLDHPAVSARHALLVTILDDSFLEDLHSTNGTFVNGHRIGKHFLQHDDTIRIAGFHLAFVADGIRPLAAGAPLPAHIAILNGDNAGKRMALTKPQTTLGRAGVPVAVIHRGHDAYAISRLDGEAPLLNGAALSGRMPLRHGDVIDLGGTQMAFRIG